MAEQGFVKVRCWVAGTQFRDWTGLTVREGDALTMTREPTNKFDANAIALHLGGAHVGYVPRAHAFKLSVLMDQGAHLVCKVTQAVPRAARYDVEIEIDEAATLTA